MGSGTFLSERTTQSVEETVAQVYGYAVRKGEIDSVETVATDLGLDPDEVSAAISTLVQSRLLREERDGGRVLVPVDPNLAGALLVSPMEREIYQRREMIAEIQDRIETFRQTYARSGRPSGEPALVDHLTGSLEVRGYLEVAGDACLGEVIALRHGREDADGWDDFLRTCSTMLHRGITVRIVCQHRSRADLSTRTRLKSLTDAGAQIRTVSHVPRAAVVFDRSLAVLLGSADGETTASRVRSDDVVAFLLDVFNHLWDAATPLDRVESGYAEIADDLRQTIAGLMAKGFTDEAVAHKLGMSVRTCRRHIAGLMHDLEAVSRFQAGVQAARRSLVHTTP